MDEKTLYFNTGPAKPAKVFDDRKDAREYAKRMDARSSMLLYWAVGVKKG